MDIKEYIADFLRDAQYRMALIGIEMDDLEDQDSPRYKKLDGDRLALYLFMDIIYVGYWSIFGGGFNHLDWTDDEIKAEAEYLRNSTEMITSPFTTFVGNYPQIVQIITGQGAGEGLPAGNPGDFIYYDANGNGIATPFPVFVGAQTGDTVKTYFDL